MDAANDNLSHLMKEMTDFAHGLIRRAYAEGQADERRAILARLQSPSASPLARAPRIGDTKPSPALREIFDKHGRGATGLAVINAIQMAAKAYPHLTEKQLRPAVKNILDSGEIERVGTGIYRATSKLQV